MYQTNHTFAICAYRESPFLEECIQSCISQTERTNILLATSTPNAYINNLCEKYSIPMHVNRGDSGITQDWNFAYTMCSTEFVTIAHQDDIYKERYVECVLKKMKKSPRPLIAFTDYYEIRNGMEMRSNRLLKIKRFLLLPLRIGCLSGSRFVRRRILSLGTPICCPSVTFARSNLPEKVFLHDYLASEDWQAWERLSRLKGDFLYCAFPLMCHRIHKESETTKLVEENVRTREDREMFEKFWPKPIAKWIARFYAKSEESNDL